MRSLSQYLALLVTETIRHEGGKWVIYSKDGSKKLGEYDTEEAAKKRLRQIEFFKRQHESTDLAFKGKAMKSHLDAAKDKIREKLGTTDVTYKQAMKVVGATLAARLTARGMVKRSDGDKSKGELGKQ